jgi:hypothetical protein
MDMNLMVDGAATASELPHGNLSPLAALAGPFFVDRVWQSWKYTLFVLPTLPYPAQIHYWLENRNKAWNPTSLLDELNEGRFEQPVFTSWVLTSSTGQSHIERAAGRISSDR